MASVWGGAPHGDSRADTHRADADSRADTHRADAESKCNVAFAYYNVGVQNAEVHAQKKMGQKNRKAMHGSFENLQERLT